MPQNPERIDSKRSAKDLKPKQRIFILINDIPAAISTVASVCFVADATAMLHAAVHVDGIRDNLVAGTAFDVTNKTNAATVFFVGRVIQPVLFRQAAIYYYGYNCSSLYVSLYLHC